MQSFPQTQASCPQPGSGSSWAIFRTSVCKDFPFRGEKPSPGLSSRFRAPLGAKPGNLSILRGRCQPPTLSTQRAWICELCGSVLLGGPPSCIHPADIYWDVDLLGPGTDRGSARSHNAPGPAGI